MSQLDRQAHNRWWMVYVKTPHDAELNAAEHMRSMGFLDAKATTGGADGGIDVRSRHALAQVKFYQSKLSGRPEVQNLLGARGHGDQQLFFFTSVGYSRQAVDYANQEGIGLFVNDRKGTATPVNQVARSVHVDGVQVRTWTSPDYLALLSVLRGAWRALSPKTSRRSSRQHRPRHVRR